MKAKSFFYAAAGLFLLAAAYTLGASRVQGQATSNRVVGITSSAFLGNAGYGLMAITENGDWYYQWTGNATWPNTPWIRGGNIGIGPIAVEPTTWSTTKSTYRK